MGGWGSVKKVQRDVRDENAKHDVMTASYRSYFLDWAPLLDDSAMIVKHAPLRIVDDAGNHGHARALHKARRLLRLRAAFFFSLYSMD